MTKDPFIKMSIKNLTTPEDGRIVYTDRWWSVNDNDEVLFFQTYSCPQCNHNKSITDTLGEKYGRKSVFIPIAYLPIVWSDFS